MRIRKNEKINNIPVVKIRDYFKIIRDYGFSKTDIKNYFGLSIKNTNSLITGLIKNNFIEKTLNKKPEFEYQLTTKGQSLCVVRSVPLLNKAKADNIFNKFMQRIEEINNNDYYLCSVKKVLLFGSYLNPNNENFGDIDIAVELKRKIDDIEEYNKARKKRIQDMELKGKHFSTYSEKLCYPEKEVVLKLKNRCQYISLHSTDDEILETAIYKQVFPMN